ncbi:MAG: NapC/NirT family cytochrome c [Acidobacteria bacterium]|nr:NapC/NirT family cytochrome c [Acidobacteriota bacterium]
MSDEPEEEQTTKQPTLLRNYISFAGMAICAAALTSFLMLVLIEFSGTAADNPYSALITYIFVPSILGFGIFLILLGVFLEWRRRRRDPEAHVAAFPVLDLNDPRRRRNLLIFMVLAFSFLFLTAFGSYRAFEYTESVSFCGQACHSVMKPEFVAYGASPHARVACVECHVGSGAGGYAQSKINGMRQLYGVISGHYSRPIETPVKNIPAAAETCQKCHWSEKYNGEVLKVFDHYEYDEQNSLNRTRMLIKVGGGSPEAGPVGGIHWHMNVANEVTYVAADEKRSVIPWVRMKNATGQVVEYRAKDANFTDQQLASAEKRKMDCIDCHNRPAHQYLTPNQAVDQSLSAGRIDISLPFIKAKAVEILSKPYSTTDEAVSAIAGGLNDYYKTTYPDVYSAKAGSVGGAVAEIQRIYQTYFFPEMKTDWQVHLNNIGHYNAQGCFRCHDGQHFSSDGKVIRNECSICHTTIDQSWGGKTYTADNGMFRHPVELGDRNTFQCAACHKGDRTFVHPLNLGDISQFKCSECHKGQSFKMPLGGI